MVGKRVLFFVAICSMMGLNLGACNEDDSSGTVKCRVVADCPNPDKQVCARGICAENTCANGKKDDNESGIDCGGSSDCGKCDNDKECTDKNDCVSEYCDETKHVCTSRQCTENTKCPGDGGTCDLENHVCIWCGDGIKNGSETDLDCGGICQTKCGVGLKCEENSDCETLICTTEHVCGSKPDAIEIEDLVINEVMGKANTSAKFALNENVDQCEFVEIVNLSDKLGSLDDISLILVKTDGGTTTTVDLKGPIMAKGVHVVHNCKNLPLPSDATEGALKANAITNDKAYTFTLVKNDKTSESFEIPDTKNGVSYNLIVEKDATSRVVAHTDVSGSAADASPGYCVNGGLFSENCQKKAIPCDESTACPGEMGSCDLENHVCISCADGHQNGTETGVDCGGNCSHRCADGNACTTGRDCESGLCEAQICISCSDNQKNGDETDKDCGGSCSQKCDDGEGCQSNADCLSDVCTMNACVGGAPDRAEFTKLVINEVMGSPNKNVNFSIQTETSQCEFVEIVNLDTKAVSMTNINLVFSKKDGSATKMVDLSEAIIPAKGVLVVSESSIPMPPDGRNLTLLSNTITNGSDYYIEFGEGTYTYGRVERQKLSTGNGKSQNRSEDKNTSDGVLVWHDTVSTTELNNSPGYCANGGLFSNNCAINDN